MKRLLIGFIKFQALELKPVAAKSDLAHAWLQWSWRGAACCWWSAPQESREPWRTAMKKLRIVI